MITASSLSNNTLTVIIDNSTPIHATKDHPKWAELIDAFTRKDEPCILELLSMKRTVEKYTKGGLTVTDTGVSYKGVPLHGIDVDRLIAFMRQGLPYQPIANYMARKFANPSSRAVKEMYNFLEHRRMPLNDQGFIIAYKGVQPDWYSCTGGSEPLISGKRDEVGKIFNGIGEVIEMDRNFVDDDFREGCSAGLHAGSLEYARGFGKRLILVEIDPADVVSVPSDCNCQKLRCCKYRVVGEYTGPLPNTYAPDLNSNQIENASNSDETTEDVEQTDDENDDLQETHPTIEYNLDQEVREKFTAITSEQLGLTPNAISDEKTFIGDFGCDSLDLVELVIAVEEKFGFEIPDGAADHINTFGDALELLTKAVKEYTDTGAVTWQVGQHFETTQSPEEPAPTLKDALDEADTVREKLSNSSKVNINEKVDISGSGEDIRKRALNHGKKDGKARYKRVYRTGDEDQAKSPKHAIYIKAYNKGYKAGRTDNKKVRR